MIYVVYDELSIVLLDVTIAWINWWSPLVGCMSEFLFDNLFFFFWDNYSKPT